MDPPVNEGGDSSSTFYEKVQTPKANFDDTKTIDLKVGDASDNKSGDSPLIPFLQLFRFADKKDKILLFIGTVAACGTGLMQPLQIIVFGDVLNAINQDPTLSDDETRTDAINSVVLKFMYIAIAVLVTGFAQVACWTIASTRQIRRIRSAYIKAILRQEIGWFDVNEPAELATKVADTTLIIQDGLGRKAGDGFQFISMAVGGIIIGLSYGWQLGLSLLAFTPILAFTAYYMMKSLGDAVSAGTAAYARAGGIAEESLGNIRTVHSFNSSQIMEEKYTKALEDTSAAEGRKGLAVGFGTGLMFFTVFCTYAFGMYYGATLVARDQLEQQPPCVGDNCYNGGRVLTIFFSVVMGAMALGQSGPSLQAVFSARAAAKSVYEIIDRPSLIDSSSPNGKILKDVSGHIEIKNVSFHYPSRPHIQVCKSYSLSIPAGTSVALVGESGSGKSTIVSLIERFYDPQEGTITIDGQDIQDLNVASLRQSIGLVGQEPALFQTTIGNNIGYGKPEATMEEIINAAKKANAYDFIMEMPEGFDTEVGERGAQLSGGQKQRIAIARAIMKDPAILLLDEATSALDTESERIVQESLDNLLQQKPRTTIMIAHRLSTVRNADQIAVLEAGRIVELGSHDELMQDKNGKYRHMVSVQEARNNETQLRGGIREEEVDTKLKKTSELVPVVVDSTNDTNIKTDAKEEKDLFPPVPVSRIWKLSIPDAKYMVIGAIGAAVNGATFPVWGVLLAKVTTLFFNIGLTSDEMKDEARWWSIAFALLGVLFFVSTLMQSYGFGIVAGRITKRIRSAAFRAMLRQEVGWFDREENSSGSLSTRLATDSGIIQAMTSEWLNRVLVNVFTLGVAIGIALYYSWKMTLIILAVFPMMVFASFMQMQSFGGQHNKANANEGDVKAGSLLSESVMNMRTVSSFNMESTLHQKYYEYLSQSKETERRNGFVNGSGFGVSQCMLYAVQGFLFYIGGVLITADQLDFQDMFIVLLAIMFSSFGVGMASQVMTDSDKAKNAAAQIFGIIDRKPTIDASSEEGEVLKELDGNIEFSQISFAYPTRKDASIYKDYNLSIKSGMTVALVGASGGGKSTAVALLQRFYNPSVGSITLDGHDIKTLNIQWLRNQISLVSQEPVLFTGSIADNIRVGKPSATMEEVINAAKMSNAFDFISKFPEGFATDVGDRGVQVSGGQKQRIALARAIIRDPAVLLLDEATSALDSESERVVQASLDKLLKDKKRTTIVIAHRLSTIQDADLIAVVDGGRIAELGKHDDLLRIEHGVYRSLVERQLKSSSN